VTSPPLVSVVLATHDAVTTLGQAVASVLRQTLTELELIVVDDASADGTDELLGAVGDQRLVVLHNEERLGLAASLNRGIDTARARYVARLDADDVAHPERLARQVERIGHGLPGVLGTGVLEIDDEGRPGALHVMPSGPAAVHWRALFGSPFFHPTTIIDRALLDRHGLRYDTDYEQAQDYELWTRLLSVADGDNMPDALVLRRVHPGQTSKRLRGGQRSFQLEIALRQIAAVAPELSPEEAELAWLVGAGEPVPESAPEAVHAYLTLYERFRSERRGADLSAVRVVAARAVMRAALRARAGERAPLLRRALAVDPALALRGARDRSRRRVATREARSRIDGALASLAGAPGVERPVRVTVVSPEPTPYRSPLFDRVARQPGVELTVVYAGRTVAGRTWQVEPEHRAVFLDGVRVPGVRRLLRHEYPITPGIRGALEESEPEVVVVSGWSQFASQAAIAWCRRRRVPYLLLVSSHDAVTRSAWRRAVRAPIVPRVVRGAWGAFALGTLSRASLVANGARPDRVRLFANTIDVPAWVERAGLLAARRPELRDALGLSGEDVAVLSVARLAPEKGLDTLLRAAAAADPRLVVVIAGEGPERRRLDQLAHDLGVRLVLAGDVPWERIAETYVAADVFALLSGWEPWGVVVNEAAACGLPLVLSDRVGAAPDLLVDGENGALVAAGDVHATAAALARYASDGAAREAAGTRSREIVRGWGYEPSVESFVAAVREAAGRGRG
jgi:glycosyltransferase involved in cell wall biosynthesis